MSLLQASAFITLTTLHELLHIKMSLDTLLKREYLWRFFNKKLQNLHLKLYTNRGKTKKNTKPQAKIHNAAFSLCFLKKEKKQHMHFHSKLNTALFLCKKSEVVSHLTAIRSLNFGSLVLLPFWTVLSLLHWVDGYTTLCH